MDKEGIEMKKENMNNRDEKYVNILHLIYGGVIALIVIIAVIICQPRAVHPEASNNFAFAATITSIVLAVVSIVYSIQSGSGVSSNLGSIKSIEDSINVQLGKLNDLESRITENISRKIADSNAEVCSRIDGIEKNNTESFKNQASVNVDDDKFDTNKTSVLGKVALYACYKASKTGRSLELKQCFSENIDYIYGFLIGVASVCSSKIELETDNQSIRVKNFDDNYFKNVSESLPNDSEKFKVEFVLKSMREIDEYFAASDDGEVIDVS